MKLHQHLFGNGKPLRCNAWASPGVARIYIYILYIIYICRDVHCTHQTLRSFSKSCGLQQGTVERLRQELRRELLVENWGPRRPRRWRKLCGVGSNPGILEFSDQHIAGYEFVMDHFFSPGRSWSPYSGCWCHFLSISSLPCVDDAQLTHISQGCPVEPPCPLGPTTSRWRHCTKVSRWSEPSSNTGAGYVLR